MAIEEVPIDPKIQEKVAAILKARGFKQYQDMPSDQHPQIPPVQPVDHLEPRKP